MTFPRFDPHHVIEAAAAHAATAFEVLPPALLEAPVSTIPLDIYVLLDPEAAWQVAHLALDAFGTAVVDRFGYSSLSAPMEYESQILLRLRIAVPSSMLEALIPAMETAAERTIREVLGPDAQVALSVFPAEGALDSEG